MHDTVFVSNRDYWVNIDTVFFSQEISFQLANLLHVELINSTRNFYSTHSATPTPWPRHFND